MTTTQATHLSETLASLEFDDQVLLLNALRKAMDHCLFEHERLLALECSDPYWIEHGRKIYALYKKLWGRNAYPELEVAK